MLAATASTTDRSSHHGQISDEDKRDSMAVPHDQFARTTPVANDVRPNRLTETAHYRSLEPEAGNGPPHWGRPISRILILLTAKKISENDTRI